MAHPLKHAESSARKFGGKAQDYLPIHNWFDESKAFLADFRHRALRHHAEGIFLAEKLFGVAIVNSDGKQVPVRYVGEQHVREDLGRIPAAQDWLLQIKPQRWMYGQRLDEETPDEQGGPSMSAPNGHGHEGSCSRSWPASSNLGGARNPSGPGGTGQGIGRGLGSAF